MNIMVVDDSKIMRQMIMEVCKNFKGMNVVATASDGVAAIEAFKKFNPQFITMDLTMPNLDGVEAIREIISLDASVKILVISALSDQETALESISAGAKGFLYKPFSKDELTEALIGILN